MVSGYCNIIFFSVTFSITCLGLRCVFLGEFGAMKILVSGNIDYLCIINKRDIFIGGLNYAFLKQA